MKPGKMHPRVLRDWADVVAKSLSITLGKSWQSDEVPRDWEQGNIMPIFKMAQNKDPENY